jgi:TonB family protein
LSDEIGAAPMTLPAGALTRRFDPHERQALPWLGIIAALLLHAATLAFFIIDWSLPHALPREPAVIPVQVLFEPPPPAPAPSPTAKPPPAYAESGPDQRTTAPPPAVESAPEPASPPPPAPETKAAEETPPAPPSEKPPPPERARPKPSHETARLEPPQREAATPRAPRPAPPMRLDLQPGERVERGDPYLNRLWEQIEHHRIYPRVMGNFGLLAEGTAVYGVLVDRSGRVLAMKLEHSSGVAGIDRAVEDMIRSSLPFPPVPANYPDPLAIDVSIRVFPPS